MDFYLQRALDAIELETRDMGVSALAWHPENKWSSGQILEHLTLAFTGTTKAMHRAVQDGVSRVSPSLKQRLAIALVVELGYLPGGRIAPESTLPHGTDPADAVANIRAALSEMDKAISAANAKLGSGVVASHPVLGQLTARQWRKFHWVHTLHHMRQIARLRAAYALLEKTELAAGSV